MLIGHQLLKEEVIWEQQEHRDLQEHLATPKTSSMEFTAVE
jgi:hypothetical protein